MRASLASATSLLALLLMEGHEAKAAPIVSSTTAINFGDVLIGQTGTSQSGLWTISGQTNKDNFSISSAATPFTGAGSDNTVSSSRTSVSVSYNFSPSAGGTSTDTIVGTDASRTGTASSLTLTGTGVAPVSSGPATSATVSGFYLVNSQSGTVTLTVSNTGNGYLASSTPSVKNSLYNLNGSITGSSSSVFVGAASSISLQDSHYTGTGGSTSAAYSYTFNPTIAGVSTATVTTTFSNGGGNTNSASSVTTTLSGTGVAPVASISSASNAGYVLVGTTNSVTVTVANTGNANLAGTGTAFNANGSIAALSNVNGFSGTATNLSLASNATGSTSSTATQALTYTYAPTVTGSSSAQVVASLSNASSNLQNQATSLTSSLTGTGVAPVASIAGSASTGYVLVGSSSTTSFSIANTGNGNLAGTGTAYNLNGSIGSLSSNGFTGAASSIGLASNATGSTSSTASTSSPTYTYKPTVVGSSSALVVETLSNGSTNGQNLASNQTTTLSGTGVAPIASVSNSTVYARIGAGAATGSITVANTGNANLAGTGTAYNLNGSIGAISSGSFSGAASSISLASNATGSTSSTATSTLGYTYTPGSSRAATSTTVSINFSNGNSAGTNLSQSVAATLTGSAVGPTYASTLAGKGVDTPAVNGTGTVAGAAGATISFGTVSYKVASTLLLDLGNVTTDANGGNANLTNLTIDAYSITGANASAFSVSSVSSVITEGGMLVVPITVTSNIAYSSLSSSLTIFTDEGTGLGGYGENFTYALTALSVPEPTSLAVLGAGLAGLAAFRRRKRGAQKG